MRDYLLRCITTLYNISNKKRVKNLNAVQCMQLYFAVTASSVSMLIAFVHGTWNTKLSSIQVAQCFASHYLADLFGYEPFSLIFSFTVLMTSRNSIHVLHPMFDTCCACWSAAMELRV
jgi:hypothetical protein